MLMALAALALLAPVALAAPRRVILLRHGEKADGYELTPIGRRRAEALSHQFLGKDAAMFLFRPPGRPTAT
jgi:broad specificity phosphatase PhoE